MDQVVAVSGSGKKELQDAYISKELEQAVLGQMCIRDRCRDLFHARAGIICD